MTDQFIQQQPTEQNQQPAAEQQQQQGEQFVDPKTENQGQPDTRDPAYQVGVLEKRLSDKDAYIQQLQQEAQRAREAALDYEEHKLNTERVSEALDKISSQRGTDQETPTLDEDALVGKIEQRLTQKQKEQQKEQNYNQVQQNLLKQYGDPEKANATVAKAAQESGLSTQQLIDMAKDSPKAFYKLVGIDTSNNQQQAVSPQPSHSNSISDGSETGVVKDRAYFARLRRENPREWRKPEVQREFRKLFLEDNK